LRHGPRTGDNRPLMANAAVRGGRSATVAVRADPPPIDFLLACLEEWPAAHALVRAIECRKLWRYPLAPPVLDVGCGDGRLTRMLFSPPVEAGVDVNREEVARAQRSGVYKQALCVSAATLPFRDRSFASVFSNCVLEHVDGVDRALAEICRVLRPGGTLLTTVPTPRWESDGPLPLLRRLGLAALSDRMNDVLRKMWHHVTVEDQEGWRTRLGRAGMTLLVWEPYMVPRAYAAFARYLPSSAGALLSRRLAGRWPASTTLRRTIAPLLAARLREPYLAEDSVGACAMYVAQRAT
jgi:SAM-dependent methyltransferase